MSIDKTFPVSANNMSYEKMFYIYQTKFARNAIFYFTIPTFLILLIKLLSLSNDLVNFLVVIPIALSFPLGFFSLVNNKTLFLFRNTNGEIVGSYDIPENMDALFLKIRVTGPFYKITVSLPPFRYITKRTASLTYTRTRFLVKVGSKPTVYCENLEELFLFIETTLNSRRNPQSLVSDYIELLLQEKNH